MNDGEIYESLLPYCRAKVVNGWVGKWICRGFVLSGDLGSQLRSSIKALWKLHRRVNRLILMFKTGMRR